MRVRIDRLMDGPGPGEALVAVATSDGGREEVIVHRSSIAADMIEVGNPIHRDADRALVELPSESMSGAWRIWVPLSAIA
jgi:hypothetical protein